MTAEYDTLDLDAITYSPQSEELEELPIHRQLRSRGGSRSSSRSSSSRSRTTTKRTYTRRTYSRSSRYYYSGYTRAPYMTTYVLFIYRPDTYWNVYSNRGLWGSSCQTGLHCRSGCCSSEKLSSFYSSYSVATGGFFCMNDPSSCGYGPGGGSGGIIGGIVALLFMCFCCIAAWFICKSCQGSHDSGSEHSEHVVEEVVVEEKIVEEVHHDNGP